MKGGPAQCGGGNITETLGCIPPTAIGIGVLGEPVQSALDKCAMLLGAGGCLHVLHGGTGDGSGEGTAGEFAFPMPLGNAFGEERCARGVQRGV